MKRVKTFEKFLGESIWTKLTKALKLGGDPVDVKDLVKGKEFRISSKEYLAIVEYLGSKKPGIHDFKIVDLYKDYKPLTGKAPKEGSVVSFKDQEIKDYIVTNE